MGLSGFVQPDDMVNSKSVVGIKPGHSWVLVDEYTFTWSAECFIVQWHISYGFVVKVSH